MKLLTKEQIDQLARNGRANEERLAEDGDAIDFEPVVKLFLPGSAATWLLTETDPYSPNLAYGLCDLGMGCPELGTVWISELESVRGPLGLPVERDLHFTPIGPLSSYADKARKAGRIVA